MFPASRKPNPGFPPVTRGWGLVSRRKAPQGSLFRLRRECQMSNEITHAPPPSGASRKKKGGRPSLPDDQRRDHRETIRFSEIEWQRVTEAARSAGIPTLTYIRQRALSDRIGGGRLTIPEVNQDLWRKLARLSSNLNQLAAKMNSGDRSYQSHVAYLLTEANELLRSVRRLLIGLPEKSE
jgi:hypothetical protein